MKMTTYGNMHPRIVGHRGARVSGIDENSFEAFAFAKSHGITAVELDVRLTRDRVPVVFHDATLLRMAKDSRPIHQCSRAELESITMHHGSKIPLLAEVLGWATANHIFLHIEIKGDDVDPVVVGCVANLLKDHRQPFVISSFHPLLLLRARALGLPTALLWDREHSGKRAGFLMASLFPSIGLHPNVALVTPRLIKMASLEGKYTATWTVNTVDKAQTLLGLGVSSVITDRPDLLAHLV